MMRFFKKDIQRQFDNFFFFNFGYFSIFYFSLLFFPLLNFFYYIFYYYSLWFFVSLINLHYLIILLRLSFLIVLFFIIITFYNNITIFFKKLFFILYPIFLPNFFYAKTSTYFTVLRQFNIRCYLNYLIFLTYFFSFCDLWSIYTKLAIISNWTILVHFRDIAFTKNINFSQISLFSTFANEESYTNSLVLENIYHLNFPNLWEKKMTKYANVHTYLFSAEQKCEINFLNYIFFDYAEILSFFFIVLTFLLIVLVYFGTIAQISTKKYLYFFFLILINLILLLFFLVNSYFFFFILYEFILLPVYLLSGWWGSTARKVKALYYFFFFTLFFSIFLLLAILCLYLIQSFAILDMVLIHIIFFFFFLGLAVKLPMFPLHLWLVEAHVEAPTGASMILAGILLKLGGYGIIRFLLPIYPGSALYFQDSILMISLVGVIYSSFAALAQIDVKRLIAYSSVAHMNLALLAIFSLQPIGCIGAVYSMLAHGIVASALFYLIGLLYDRYGTRCVYYYTGLVSVMPYFSVFFFLFILGNISFPGTGNFIGELLSLTSLTHINFFLLIFCGISIVICSIYSFWLYNRINFGVLNKKYIFYFVDVTFTEFLILTTFTFFLLFLGLYPNFILLQLEKYFLLYFLYLL